MGIEMQATFWAYAQTGALGNMFFRRYFIINKTDILGIQEHFDICMFQCGQILTLEIQEMTLQAVIRCLVFLMLITVKGQDAIYGGVTPAVGFDFFQGPKVVGNAGEDLNKNGVDDAEDFAIFKNQRIGPGFINLPMTAAYYYINQDPTLTDPVQGSYSEGAVRWYRFMQGRIGLTNEPFIDPNTGLADIIYFTR